ncbi:ABC transporter substrate-binding protein [bacterium]|nr:ABC transporter substrate-binding protein [bacterium]
MRYACSSSHFFVAHFLRCARILLAWIVLALAACMPADGSTPSVLDSNVDITHNALDELPRVESYRVGLHTEVTGPGAQIGDLSIRAARLAVEEVNAQGGIHGVPLELVVRDVRSDPVVSLAQYHAALAEDNLVALLGPFKSAYAVSVVQAHVDADLPLFIGATNAGLTQQDDINLFRMRPSDAVTAAALVTFAVDALDSRRPAVVHDTDAFGSGGARLIQDELQRRGLSPVHVIGYDTAIGDLEGQIAPLTQGSDATDDAANGAVDTVLIYGTNPTDIARILRELRYWNRDVQIVTSPGGATVPTFNIAADAQDGIYVVTDALLTDTDAGRAFHDAFVARFNIEPDTYIAWSYDAVHLLAAALRQQPQAAGDALSAQIRNFPFDGAQGPYRFDAQGNSLVTVAVVQMQNGVAQPVGLFRDGELVLSFGEISDLPLRSEVNP